MGTHGLFGGGGGGGARAPQAPMGPALTRKVQFLSLPKSEISSLLPSSVAVQPGLSRTWSKTPKTGFLRTRLEPQREKTGFLHMRKQRRRSASRTAKLISAFVFASRIVQSLFFLIPKFQASSHLLWLYSPVCVGPGRKPEDRYSHNEARIFTS